MKVKTINLTGEETKIEFDKSYAFVEINNLSKSEILVSVNAKIVRGNDDVVILPSKTIVTIGDSSSSTGIKEIYISGNGEIQLIAKNYAEHSFKVPASGDSSDENSTKILPFSDGVSIVLDTQSNIVRNDLQYTTNPDNSISFTTNFKLTDESVSTFTEYFVVKTNGSPWLTISGQNDGAIPQFNLAVNTSQKLAIGSGAAYGQLHSSTSAVTFHACAVTLNNQNGCLYTKADADENLKYNAYQKTFSYRECPSPNAVFFHFIAVSYNVCHSEDVVKKNLQFLNERYSRIIGT